ncbi:MAG: hypothetical protein LBP38_02235 [Desulfovibrio sp.]|jgi:hypothetical protein|nr:hypothetical protein [Desulfovibrio sp.]
MGYPEAYGCAGAHPEYHCQAGRLVDAVLRDIGADRPLDVAGHARRMGMDGPAYMPDGRPVLRTDALIAEGRPSWEHLSVEDMLPAAEDFYKDVLAGQRCRRGEASKSLYAGGVADVEKSGGGRRTRIS